MLAEKQVNKMGFLEVRTAQTVININSSERGRSWRHAAAARAAGARRFRAVALDGAFTKICFGLVTLLYSSIPRYSQNFFFPKYLNFKNIIPAYPRTV